MYSNLTPLALPPTRRRPQPAVAQAPPQEQVVYETPKRPALDIPTADARALARRITEMGRVRRGEITDGGAALTHPVAKAIVAAAALVRSGGPPPSLPSNRIARAVCLVGQKVRGTISASDALWLADFLRGIEAARGSIR
jgi:hypothetical protein